MEPFPIPSADVTRKGARKRAMLSCGKLPRKQWVAGARRAALNVQDPNPGPLVPMKGPPFTKRLPFQVILLISCIKTTAQVSRVREGTTKCSFDAPSQLHPPSLDGCFLPLAMQPARSDFSPLRLATIFPEWISPSIFQRRTPCRLRYGHPSNRLTRPREPKSQRPKPRQGKSQHQSTCGR